MGLILWLIFGALVGWLASLINGTNEAQGWIGNIVLGIVGALVGGFLYSLIADGYYETDFNIGSLIFAVVGHQKSTLLTSIHPMLSVML
jgi:uncharacterized membrane protein YeaQ/YmgE (transglycosylase-associated protein family)